jgi:hypothetical protein
MEIALRIGDRLVHMTVCVAPDGHTGQLVAVVDLHHGVQPGEQAFAGIERLLVAYNAAF